MSNRIRIYMTGVGGQGTLTATTLLARVAVKLADHASLPRTFSKSKRVTDLR